MNDSCPDPSVWVAWRAGALAPAGHSRWEGHLTACAACRAELASLASLAAPAPLRPALQARSEGLSVRDR